MRILTVAMVGGLLLAGTNPAFAQDEDEDMPAGPEATSAPAGAGAAQDGDGEEGAKAAPKGSGQAYANAEQRFPIRRGFFAEGDFGIFMTLGGRNTNNEALPSRGTSNVQPYLGVLVGYDLVTTDTINFAAGFKGALMLNGGAGRVTGADINNSGNPEFPCAGDGDDLCTKSNDYEVWQVGVGGALDYLLTDRLGLAFKLDGGLALLNPSPFEAANQVGGDSDDAVANYPNAGKVAIGGIFSVSAGVSYATLLTGFTVGVDVRFSGVVGGGFIPALSATVPIKYNF
jgi:hypothetical protein